MKRILLILLLLVGCALDGHEGELKLYLLHKIIDGTPGQTAVLQIYLNNQTNRALILADQLDLPPGWSCQPIYPFYSHLSPHQNYMHTIAIKIPAHAPEGEYRIRYKSWSRTNLSIQACDDAFVVVRPLPPPPPRVYIPPVVTLTSADLEAKPGEVIFLSIRVDNPNDTEMQQSISLQGPESWQVLPCDNVEVTADPNDSALAIFGVKIPEDALTGEYPFAFLADDQLIHSASVQILPQVQFRARFEGLQTSYMIGDVIYMTLICENLSNVPLPVNLEARGDPCCQVHYAREPFVIPAKQAYAVPITVFPEFHPDGNKQFLLLEVKKSDTCERLYQNTLSLNLLKPGMIEDDLYNRIPAYIKGIALGDNGKHVLAVEFAGGGLINPERNRYLDFFFRIPTESRNVIYNAEQCLYVGLSEDTWNLDLGDTNYNLTPLTQRCIYGRGAGFDVYPYPWFCGAHYSQNIFNNDYNPREACGYAGFSPVPNLDMAVNYMHKDLQHTPTTNIVSLTTDFQYPCNVCTELEIAKNFLNTKEYKNTNAFRVASRGRFGYDYWFDVEKIYAGPEFFGYYQDFDLFAASTDFPLGCCVRGNLSYNRLKQNAGLYYDHYKEYRHYDLYEYGSHKDVDDDYPFFPRQRQYNAQLIYSLCDGVSLSATGMLLRAQARGPRPIYNFNQGWGGVGYSIARRSFVFTGNCAWGRQKDYLHHCSIPLQRYYFFACRDINANTSASLFLEAGNTNYYDAKPWRTTYGGALHYCYGFGSSVEFYAQRVNNASDMFQLSQFTGNINHTFRNMHVLQACVQYFHYEKHYPNDFLFMVSYAIPFSIPTGRRTDIGTLNGCVYDAYANCPVPKATINCQGCRVVTDEQGRFSFPSLPVGEHQVTTEMLPYRFVSQDSKEEKIRIIGGHDHHLTVPVVCSGLIEGEVLQYVSPETFQQIQSQLSGKPEEVCEQGGVKGTRVFVCKEGGKEIYSALTNSRGHFCFPKLRPGKWELFLNANTLPRFYDPEVERILIDLKPGEQKNVTFKIVPQVKNIQRFDEGA